MQASQSHGFLTLPQHKAPGGGDMNIPGFLSDMTSFPWRKQQAFVQNISSVELLQGRGSESPGASDKGQSGCRGRLHPIDAKCPDRGLELTNTAGLHGTRGLIVLHRAASTALSISLRRGDRG